MSPTAAVALRLATALGIGLLVGAERERRKGQGPSRSPAGIRTFAVSSLLGAISLQAGELLFAIAMAAVSALIAIAYFRSRARDPGLTTEVALLLTVLLGGIAMREPALASGLGVTVAIILASRSRIHRFVHHVVTESELNDALVLAAAVLVVLPLVPNRYVGPLHLINPRLIWKIVLLVISISSAGYILVRLLGARLGLPLAGLFSGFFSSAATIASMGSRAKAQPSLSRPAVAGAVLSTVATILELAAVLAASSRSVLAAMAIPLVSGGIVACLYAVFFTWKNVLHEAPTTAPSGSAFSLKGALIFAATLTAVLFASVILNSWLGKPGLIVATAVAGFADAHSASFSAASLVAAGKLNTSDAIFPCLAALSTNTVTKSLLAITSGGRRFAIQVIPGLILVIGALWVATFFPRF